MTWYRRVTDFPILTSSGEILALKTLPLSGGASLYDHYREYPQALLSLVVYVNIHRSQN